MFEQRGGALCSMKLFAYEHPSGPVHEVEVTLGDTVHGGVDCSPTPRRRVGGDEAPQDRRPVTTPRAAAASRILDGPHACSPRHRKRVRSPAQIQDRGPCGLRRGSVQHPTLSRDRVGSMAWRFRRSAQPLTHGVMSTRPTARSSKRKNSTSPSAARNLMMTRRRSRRSGSRRTTRCARSPSR